MRPSAAHRPLGMVERFVWAFQVFVVLIAVWFGLNGLDRLLVGVLAAAVGGALAGWLVTDRPHAWRPDRLVGFVGYFLLESLRGGADVAWRALHPAMPVQPAFVRFEHGLPAGQPRTLMVSVLSLLPGTLSADLVDGGRVLVVHVLTDAAGDSVDRLRSRVRWLFALPEQVP